MIFGFGDGYAMADMTPVDNQFIREYLPMASGDYVRVYLYGLMCCHHPEAGKELEEMSRELDLPEEEILKAYRYWERRGLVRRISDRPPAWQYLPVRSREREAEGLRDPAYEAFAESLYGVFSNERRLHGSEIQTCYEWVTELKLPPEAVIMLLKHMETVKGKNFTIHSAEKMALKMAEEKIRTLEEAEEFLSRDEEIYNGTKAVLRRLGKRNAPSEDQLALYRKWTREWGFTREAVEDACAETAKGDPNMGYLDGVLRKIRARSGEESAIGEDRVRQDRERAEGLRDLLSVLGQGSVSDATLAWYDRIQAEYPKELIFLAARECARTGGRTASVEKMLASWRSRGITGAEEAERYVAEFRAESETLLALRKRWGLSGRLGEKDRELLRKWEKELGFGPEMILKAADYAAGSEKPMAYLDAILRDYAARGIRTAEAAERDRAARKAGSGPRAEGTRPAAGVPAQQYSQRDYAAPRESVEDVMKRLNGGVLPDA